MTKHIKLIWFLGILLMVVGLGLNEKVLALWFSPDDRQIVHLPFRILIAFLNIVCTGIGFLLICYRKTVQLRHFIAMLFLIVIGASVIFVFDLAWAYKNLGQYLASRTGVEHVLDDYLGWKLPPNLNRNLLDGGVMTTTAQGTRSTGKEVVDPRLTIHFFGDSFTFGKHISDQDVFASIIANEYVTPDIHVVNHGVDAYGIPQMFQKTLMVADEIKKGDLVVWTPITHDIVRTYQALDFVVYQTFNPRVKLQQFPVYKEGSIVIKRVDSWSLKLVALMRAAPIMRRLWSRLINIEDTSVEDASEMVAIAKKQVLARGAQFALFFLPDRDAAQRRDYGLDLTGFNYIDLIKYSPLKVEESSLWYIPDDGHYSPLGHREVAKAIIKELVQHQFLKKDDLIAPQKLDSAA